MRSPVRTATVRYGYAILAVAITLGAALALESFDLEGFLFVFAVALAVRLGGWGPAVLATVLSILVLHFFFIAPLDTGAVLSTYAYFTVFSVLAVLITVLTEARHRAGQSLLQARDELETKVQERTAELRQSNRQLREEMIERQRAEEEVRTAEAKLAHVTRVTTLGEVTASLGHELNQPLAAIVNNANASVALLLDESPDLDEVRDALADIIRDAERASMIIERVRALARRSLTEKALLHLGDVVADVVALAATESAARGVIIRSDIPADLPTVSGDRVQLQQVLLNLVVNGMDAMSNVDDDRRRLEIRGQRETEKGTLAVTISVRDYGVGVNPGEMVRLFETFYTTKAGGMGMGLSISRSIIEAHGGRLWAESNPGQGATFSFCLPAAAPSSRD